MGGAAEARLDWMSCVDMGAVGEPKKRGTPRMQTGKTTKAGMDKLKILADIASRHDDPQDANPDKKNKKGASAPNDSKIPKNEMCPNPSAMTPFTLGDGSGMPTQNAIFVNSPNGFANAPQQAGQFHRTMVKYAPQPYQYFGVHPDIQLSPTFITPCYQREDKASKLGPGQHMRQDTHKGCIERARAVKRDKPSKEMFKDALLQMEEHGIVKLTRSANVDIGIHGICLVEVLQPVAFSNRIWPKGEQEQDNIITFFPPGYKSEAKKPKNTFIAQWDRKGFEHSYSIADDLKITSASPEGRPGPIDFREDIRYRRVVAFLLDVCAALQHIAEPANPPAPLAHVRAALDERLAIAVSDGWRAVRFLFDEIICAIVRLQGWLRVSTRGEETRSKWAVLRRAIDAAADDGAAAAGADGGGGRHPRAQGAYCEALKFILDRIGELYGEFSLRHPAIVPPPPPPMASPVGIADATGAPPGLPRGGPPAAGSAAVAALDELRRRVEGEVGADGAQVYPTMYVWTAEQWRKKKPESESARKKRKAAELTTAVAAVVQPPPPPLPRAAAAPGGAADSAATTREGSRTNSETSQPEAPPAAPAASPAHSVSAVAFSAGMAAAAAPPLTAAAGRTAGAAAGVYAPGLAVAVPARAAPGAAGAGQGAGVMVNASSVFLCKPVDRPAGPPPPPPQAPTSTVVPPAAAGIQARS